MISLHLGDCFDHLQDIPMESIQTIFLDPPYGLNLRGTIDRPNGGTYRGVADHEWDSIRDWSRFFTNLYLICLSKLTPTGTIWICGTYHNIADAYPIIKDSSFLLNEIIWKKTNPIPNFMGARFTASHETIIWAKYSSRSSYLFNYQVMKEYNGGKQMTDIWEIPTCRGKERLRGEDGKILHPTQKPEELLRRIILASTNEGDTILDPFMGTGTTMSVAQQLGRKGIGIERDEIYYQAAMKRIVENVKGTS